MRSEFHQVLHPGHPFLFTIVAATVLSLPSLILAGEEQNVEVALRTLVRANAEKDIETLSKLIAHDADIISYTIGGRKYVGWPDLEQDFLEEFCSPHTIEIPVLALSIWIKGDLAWFAMEIDYIRTTVEGQNSHRSLLPLRETGVLVRRNGEWLLLSWHESFRNASGATSPIACTIVVRDTRLNTRRFAFQRTS